MPNNREAATLILVGAFMLFCLTVPSVRKQVPGLVRSLLPLTWFLAIYLTVAALVIWGAWKVNLWTTTMWWSTIVVTLGLGISLAGKSVGVRSLRELWVSVAGRLIGWGFLVGLYASLTTFPLIAELALLLIGSVSGALGAYAAHHDQKPVRRFATAALSLVGVLYVARTTLVLAHGMPTDGWVDLTRRALLGVWFPFALFPFLYLSAFFSNVERAVIGVRVHMSGSAGKWWLIGRLFWAFRLRLSLAAAFNRQWGRLYHEASSWRERREVLVRFRRERRENSAPVGH